MPLRLKYHLKILLNSVLFAAVFLEVLGWVIRPEMLPLSYSTSEDSFGYVYDDLLGWFPQPLSDKVIRGARRVKVHINSHGLRGKEWGKKQKPRILFLGDSFVWGADVEENERFDVLLQDKLPEWEVISAGVSGYGNDQEYLLLKKFFDEINPDIVVQIYVGRNDVFNNTTNYIYGGYKPYFEEVNGVLTLGGVPVPRSAQQRLSEVPLIQYSYLVRGFTKIVSHTIHPGARILKDPTLAILKETSNYIIQRGGVYQIGFESISAALRQQLIDNNIPLIDLTTDLRFTSHENHWTADGHIFVAEKLCSYWNGQAAFSRDNAVVLKCRKSEQPGQASR